MTTDNPLPPGLGNFPLRHLDDFASGIPDKWLSRGGVIMPIHQAEAMWVSFGGDEYPFAVKIATGKICAVTGDTWVNQLNNDPQDYIVSPEQPWLDGYCVEKGVIRQFVAMPLGDGYSVEEQISGTAEHGGVQIIVYPMKKERYEVLKEERLEERLKEQLKWRNMSDSACYSVINMDMGLAPGGRMRQKIYDDPYGLDAWDQRNSSRCFVTIANSAVWTSVTAERPPTKPPTAKEYTEYGLPWFDYYGGDNEAVEGATKFAKLVSVAFAKLVSVAEMGKEETPLPENQSVEVKRIVTLRSKGSNQVREIDLTK